MSYYRYVEAYSVADGVWLILTNLSILPALIKAAAIKRYALLSLFVIVGIASSAHHACGSFGACAASPQCMCATDHFFVYTTVVWIGLFMFGLEGDAAAACALPAMAVAFPLSFTHPYDLWATLVPVATAAVVAFGVILYTQRTEKPAWETKDLAVCLALFSAGSAVFMVSNFKESSRSYPWMHGLWHVLSMLGCYFALEIRDGTPVISKAARYFGHITAAVVSLFRRKVRDIDSRKKGGAKDADRAGVPVAHPALKVGQQKQDTMYNPREPNTQYNMSNNKQVRRRTHAYVASTLSIAILLGLMLYNVVVRESVVSFNFLSMLFPCVAAATATMASAVESSGPAVSISIICNLLALGADGFLMWLYVMRMIHCNDGSATGHLVDICANETAPLYAATICVGILAVFNVWMFFNGIAWASAKNDSTLGYMHVSQRQGLRSRPHQTKTFKMSQYLGRPGSI